MSNTEFDVIIDGSKNKLRLRELLQYKDLISLFTERSFTLKYKQTVLGPAWLFLNPLLTSVVFTFIFGQLAGMSTDGVPDILFYLSGNCLWGILSSCVTSTSTTLTANASVYGKVYFPRLVIPISQMLTSVINFAIQFIMFIMIYVYYLLVKAPIQPNIALLYAPLVILQMALLGWSIGLIVAALTTKYRDLIYAVAFGVQLWMYITPIVYPYSALAASPSTRFVVGLNPATIPVEVFRHALFGSGQIHYPLWGLSIALTALLLILGLKLFNRVERTFVDTI